MKNQAFSTVELVVGILMFSAATGGILVMGKAVRDHRLAAATANAQNAYATFQSQVALQGINPSLVANPLGDAVARGDAIGSASVSLGRNLSASFEAGAVSQPAAAQRSLAGSVRVDAVNYSVASAGNQSTRGAGIGFGIETAGPAPAGSANAIQLAPPTFNVTGDLTHAAFPLNDIATLPSGNPTGTVYRYTTDGTTPTGSSPVWDNNPGWTPATFPAQVTIEAFNPDPQYAASPAAGASYSMQLSLAYSRADSRTTNLYGFTYPELAAAGTAGIVLTGSIDGYAVYYTLDGSDPASSPTAVPYSGAFAPTDTQFAPSATLKAVAVSTDARVTSSPVMTYVLDATQVALTAPSFVTSNAQPLTPGTQVVISVSGSGATPRTEVNNGAPGQNSSQATSFPLN
jgi:hypothetical protein